MDNGDRYHPERPLTGNRKEPRGPEQRVPQQNPLQAARHIDFAGPSVAARRLDLDGESVVPVLFSFAGLNARTNTQFRPPRRTNNN